MVRPKQIIVYGLRNPHTEQLVALLTAVVLYPVNRVHGVISTDQEEVADFVLFQDLQDSRQIFLLDLVAGGPESGRGGEFEPVDKRFRLFAQVDQPVLHQSFDCKPHPVDTVDAG